MAEETAISAGNGSLRLMREDGTGTFAGDEERPDTLSSGYEELEGSASERLLTARKLPGARRGTVKTRALYRDTGSWKITRALNLSQRLRGSVDEAVAGVEADDAMRADECVRRARVELLPELFCLRELGDGFGMLVNAIMTSLHQLEEELPTLSQLRALRKAVEKLETEPFLRPNAAIEAIMELEDAGFDVDHPGLASLSDVLEASR